MAAAHRPGPRLAAPRRAGGAAAAGIVIGAGWDGDYGNIVIPSPRQPGQSPATGTWPASTRDIRPGTRVGIGQRIGIEGSTGTSTGLHLHFQIEVDRTPVDPVRFMPDHGAPLDGKAVAAMPGTRTDRRRRSVCTGTLREGGIGFPTAHAREPRGETRCTTRRCRSRPEIKKLYVAAADRYKIPWTLLAGIGMEETGHGRNNHTSSAGAQGLMQFMPATWASMGVDGDHDGRADIHNDADSIYSAANYLTKSGVSQGAAGVRKALFAYNPINWYVNDVLFYAAPLRRRHHTRRPQRLRPSGSGNREPAAAHQRPRRDRARPGPKATTATPTAWAPPARTPGTAPASPKPPTHRSASECPGPPPRNAAGSPPETASASGPARNNQAT